MLGLREFRAVLGYDAFIPRTLLVRGMNLDKNQMFNQGRSQAWLLTGT